MGYVLIYTTKEGKRTHKTVTWQNYHAIAGLMHRELKNPAPKNVIAAKLENHLRAFEGR